TSWRKLVGGSAGGSVIFTGMVVLLPATSTVTFVSPLPTGRTQPCGSTVASFGSADVILASPRRSTEYPSAVVPITWTAYGCRWWRISMDAGETETAGCAEHGAAAS